MARPSAAVTTDTSFVGDWGLFVGKCITLGTDLDGVFSETGAQKYSQKGAGPIYCLRNITVGSKALIVKPSQHC